MTNEEAKKLIAKYNAGQCTASERALLDSWFAQLETGKAQLPQNKLEEMGEEIFKKLPGNKIRTVKLWVYLSSAVAAIVIIVGTWIFNPLQYTSVYTAESNDISPGGNKATLTLDNGKTIELSAAQTAVVIAVNKLTYQDGTVIDGSSSSYKGEGTQTISTPKGGQYGIVLPDGTKIWLNAATVLQFPANLQRGPKREVKLVSGEAYFEVAKDKSHPFVVTTGRQEVMVLGTHFNVNAYESGSVKTTLLEGSVTIRNINTGPNHKSNILVPGEQSVNRNGLIEVRKVDVDVDLAWKNGRTEFYDQDIRTVMEALERWYDIEPEYRDVFTEARFSASIPRNRNISEVLKLLESTGEVHFEIRGRKVLVTK